MNRSAPLRKLLASIAVIAAAASIAGLGTYATFTSSTAAETQALTSGTVSIALGSVNRLAVGASNLVNAQPVIGSYTLAGLSALSAGGTDHLRIKLLLPSGAGNSFQGLSSTLGYVFTATQRAAASK